MATSSTHKAFSPPDRACHGQLVAGPAQSPRVQPTWPARLLAGPCGTGRGRAMGAGGSPSVDADRSCTRPQAGGGPQATLPGHRSTVPPQWSARLLAGPCRTGRGRDTGAGGSPVVDADRSYFGLARIRAPIRRPSCRANTARPRFRLRSPAGVWQLKPTANHPGAAAGSSSRRRGRRPVKGDLNDPH